MCEISDQLKLCTCGGKELENLDDYWILYRFDKDKDYMIIGEPQMPLNLLYLIETGYNYEDTLLALLNQHNCFDFPYNPKEKDRLLFCLKPNSWPQSVSAGEDDRLNYGYEFKKGKWRVCEYSVFEWEWHHNVLKSGEAVNVFDC